MPTGIYQHKKGHKGYKRPPFSEEWRRKIGEAGKGRKASSQTRKKMSLRMKKKPIKFWKGKKIPLEVREKMSIAHKARREKNHLWKGGITPINMEIRASKQSRLWREAIFERDDWTCQKYGIRGGKLHAHHIFGFSDYPELRFAIDNGITLSEKAHREFHKKYGWKKNTKEQIVEFVKQGIEELCKKELI